MPKKRNNATAAQWVYFLDIWKRGGQVSAAASTTLFHRNEAERATKLGAAQPIAADSIVIATSAANAPANT